MREVLRVLKQQPRRHIVLIDLEIRVYISTKRLHYKQDFLLILGKSR